MKNLFLLSLLAIGCLLELPGQGTQASFCGTNTADQQRLINTRQLSNHFSIPESGIIYIPIQVHILRSDAGNGGYNLVSLQESLCTLNNDFKNTGIQFYFENEVNYIDNSKWDSHPRFEAGIEMMKINNIKNVINCYIVTDPAGNCGYFAYEGDAVALSKTCLGKSSHTWAHELGHYFSLPHTFFGWEGTPYSYNKPTIEYQGQVWRTIENVDRNNCPMEADGFCDTPPDYISNRWSCDENSQSSSVQRDINNEEFKSDGSLFMSYANDACMSRFAADQSKAMINYLMSTRSNLLRSSINYVGIEAFKDDLFFPIDSSTISAKDVIFNWNKASGAESYLFQLSRTAAFSLLIQNVRTENNFIKLDSIPTGKNFYWRVIPINKFDFCAQSSKPLYFNTNVISSSNDITQSENVKIYPNPVGQNKTLFVVASNTSSLLDISIFDLAGKKIELNTISILEGGTNTINLEEFKAGIYFLRIKNSEKEVIKKIIISNN